MKGRSARSFCGVQILAPAWLPHCPRPSPATTRRLARRSKTLKSPTQPPRRQRGFPDRHLAHAIRRRLIRSQYGGLGEFIRFHLGCDRQLLKSDGSIRVAESKHKPGEVVTADCPPPGTAEPSCVVPGGLPFDDRLLRIDPHQSGGQSDPGGRRRIGRDRSRKNLTPSRRSHAIGTGLSPANHQLNKRRRTRRRANNKSAHNLSFPPRARS